MENSRSAHALLSTRAKTQDPTHFVADLLTLLSNAPHTLELPPHIVCEQPDMDADLARLLAVLDAAYEDPRKRIEDDGFFELVTTLIIGRASSPQAADLWRHKAGDLSRMLSGCSSLVAASRRREADLLARGGTALAEALGYPPKQVVGFAGLLAFDTKEAISLVSNISEASPSIVNALHRHFVFALPLRGLLATQEHAAAYSRSKADAIILANKDAETLTYEALCIIVDVDLTNTLSFSEYCHALKILGMDMSESRMLLAFALDDTNGMGRISFDAFERGMQRVHRQMAARVLSIFGIDFVSLVKGAIAVMLLFCVFLMFVFVGMSAFAKAGTLGTCVNGMLPALAGGGSSGAGSSKRIQDQLAKLFALITATVEAILQAKTSLSGQVNENKLDPGSRAILQILSNES